MPALGPSPASLSPYLVVRGAQAAIDFYVQALGARLDFKLIDPADGRIGHAELLFGATRLFIADEYPDFGAVGPETIGGSPVKLHLDVADADAFVANAVRHGATVLRAVKLEFHGHRSGLIADPFGYSWFVASKAEDVGAEEMQRRWNAMAAGSLS
ncbi:MAG: VOC family protein [Caulobacteraceae bacterium]|nr:MAG: VOC family protein [Caulobacteraceae bacterium]